MLLFTRKRRLELRGVPLRPGDRIKVGDIRGAPGILVVLYVEHHPGMLPVPATANQDPSVSICARFIQDLSDDVFGPES
jgi:hypothetical protein